MVKLAKGIKGISVISRILRASPILNKPHSSSPCQIWPLGIQILKTHIKKPILSHTLNGKLGSISYHTPKKPWKLFLRLHQHHPPWNQPPPLKKTDRNSETVAIILVVEKMPIATAKSAWPASMPLLISCPLASRKAPSPNFLLLALPTMSNALRSLSILPFCPHPYLALPGSPCLHV